MNGDPPQRHIPRATYRLQLTPERGFAYARSLVDYLSQLGVSHIYLSPSLEAVPGSQHGYDVTDPGTIREELGGAAGLAALRDAAHEAGLGLVLDIVPNHVGLISPHNPWWWDVLAHGPESAYAGHLDIDWRPGPFGQPSLLLPELGQALERELAGGDLRLRWGTDPVGAAPIGWRIVYHEHVWPLAPGSLVQTGLDPDDIDGTLDAVTQDRAVLRELLDRQHYRLRVWTEASRELDHRRFFAVTTLGGVRIEDPDVFEDAHARILELVRNGTIDGLRIDHPDGLTDPVGYFERLRTAIGERTWLVVEKILEHGERFRTDWPIDGTVGYELADPLLKLHIDPGGVEAFDELHAWLTDHRIDRAELAESSQRYVVSTMFAPEVHRLVQLLLAAWPDSAPPPVEQAEATIIELLVAFPTYRTYVRPELAPANRADADVLRHALAMARARRPELAHVLEATVALLRAEELSPPGSAARTRQETFVRRFQQQTGPVIAKGVEDTLLYRDLRFVAVNEVGGDPGRVESGIGPVHELHEQVQRERPATMRLSSTHDTKRAVDVRARLAVLSQDADHWVRTVQRWRALTAAHRRGHGPTPSHEHLVFQTIVGAWPIGRDRLWAYLQKAVREGGEVTGHTAPDTRYEGALSAYLDALLADERFLAEVEQVVEEVRTPGWLTSLSMLAVTCTAPGVPDVYQGDELWDLSLVDPDNRRPVDHDQRRRVLADVAALGDPTDVFARLDEGVPKLWLLQRLLGLRAERPEAFGTDGTYSPIWAGGERSDHLLAFLRGGDVAVLAPLRVRQLGPDPTSWAWGDTSVVLPEGVWTDVLSGRRCQGGMQSVADQLARFPVAVLART